MFCFRCIECSDLNKLIKSHTLFSVQIDAKNAPNSRICVRLSKIVVIFWVEDYRLSPNPHAAGTQCQLSVR